MKNILLLFMLPLIVLGQNEKLNYFHDSGRYKLQSKDYYGAINDFTKCIELEPRMVSAFQNRACAKFELKNYDGALYDINKAIQLEPNDGFLHWLKAYFKYDAGCSGKYANCCKDYKKACSLGSQTACNKLKEAKNNYIIAKFLGCDF